MIAWVLKYITPRDYVIGGLIVVVVYSATMWHKDAVELKEAKLVYQNPEVKTVEHVVYKEGPVRTVTKIIKEPTREITVITEERAPVEKTVDSGTEQHPVPIAQVMTPTRTDRYLITAGLNRLTADLDGKAIFVGYGIRNRVDIQIGGVEHDGFSPWLLATLRF